MKWLIRITIAIAAFVGFVQLAVHAPLAAIILCVLTGAVLAVTWPLLLGHYVGKKYASMKEREWTENRRNAELMAGNARHPSHRS